MALRKNLTHTGAADVNNDSMPVTEEATPGAAYTATQQLVYLVSHGIRNGFDGSWSGGPSDEPLPCLDEQEWVFTARSAGQPPDIDLVALGKRIKSLPTASERREERATRLAALIDAAGALPEQHDYLMTVHATLANIDVGGDDPDAHTGGSLTLDGETVAAIQTAIGVAVNTQLKPVDRARSWALIGRLAVARAERLLGSD